jgi:hypothetical protein
MITGPERRRPWSEEQKRAIVAARLEPVWLSLTWRVGPRSVQIRSIGGGNSSPEVTASLRC